MIRHMVILVALTAAAAAHAGTVRAGLEAIASQPYAATAKVVKVRGERGDPAPAEWTFLLTDPKARGGFREVTFSGGRITSERTPLRGLEDIADLVPIDSAAIQTDAGEAFKITHKEAEKNQLGFDWVHYVLTTDPDSRAPVWKIRLSDSMGAPVGVLRISAKNGSVVTALQADPDARARAAATPASKPGGIIGNVSRTTERAVRSTKDSTLRFIGTLQEELVGERTIGPKENE